MVASWHYTITECKNLSIFFRFINCFLFSSTSTLPSSHSNEALLRSKTAAIQPGPEFQHLLYFRRGSDGVEKHFDNNTIAYIQQQQHPLSNMSHNNSQQQSQDSTGGSEHEPYSSVSSLHYNNNAIKTLKYSSFELNDGEMTSSSSESSYRSGGSCPAGGNMNSSSSSTVINKNSLNNSSSKKRSFFQNIRKRKSSNKSTELTKELSLKKDS